jgi:hypothetical protein
MVGAQVLEALLLTPAYTRIIAVTRRPLLGRESQRLANRIVAFAQLEAQLKGLSCDAAISCLGTSYKEAGSEAAFREAVLLNVLAFARAAKASGARRFVMLSCHTASSASRRIAERVQGEALDGLAAIGFESLDIVLPGPLLGVRRGGGLPHLMSMSGAMALRPLQFGARERQRAVSVSQVAAAMLGAIRSGRRGINRYEFSGIQALSRMHNRT